MRHPPVMFRRPCNSDVCAVITNCRMMAESPEAYIGDDLTSANTIATNLGITVSLMHDPDELAPAILVMRQSPGIQRQHFAVMLISSSSSSSSFHYIANK